MSEEKEMSFLGHIGELRAHLVRSIIAIIIFAIIVGFNINWVMDHIFFGPTRSDFFTFKVVNYFSRELTGADSFIIPAKFSVQQKQLFQQFNVMMAVSIFSGLVLAFPYLVWEIWRFISPALMPAERKNSIFYINSVWILFMCGVLTGYFLILPFAINFGLLFQVSDNIVQLFDLSDYTTLFLQVTIGMGLVFLFPIAVYILTSIGIFISKFLKTYRRHAIVLIMVVAAIITPADVLSMMAAALPLVLLYEISIIMSNVIFKKMQRKLATGDIIKP